ASAGSKRVPPPAVLAPSCGASRIEAAAGEHHLTVKTWLSVLECVDFNHSSHFSSVFRRNACGVNAQRLQVVSVHGRSEAGRAIVGQRDAIDYKLRLILRAAGMQDGIAFIEPAGL